MRIGGKGWYAPTGKRLLLLIRYVFESPSNDDRRFQEKVLCGVGVDDPDHAVVPDDPAFPGYFLVISGFGVCDLRSIDGGIFLRRLAFFEGAGG